MSHRKQVRGRVSDEFVQSSDEEKVVWETRKLRLGNAEAHRYRGGSSTKQRGVSCTEKLACDAEELVCKKGTTLPDAKTAL